MATKSIFRVIMTLLVVVLAGCAAAPQPRTHSQTQPPQEVRQPQPQSQTQTRSRASARVQPQAGSKVRAQPRTVLPLTIADLSVFPNACLETSSSDTKWKKIHEDGFKGSDEKACELIGLSKTECGQLHKALDNGDCVKTMIPNGVCLEAMAFSRGKDEHLTMRNFIVELSNPEDANSFVCRVGRKAVILPTYCKNLAVVNDWFSDKPPVRKYSRKVYKKPANPTKECPLDNARYQFTSILEEAAIEHPCSQQLVSVMSDNGLDGPRLSRTCGPKFYHENSYLSGILNHVMELFFIPDVQSGAERFEIRIFKGSITQNQLTGAPGFEDMVFYNMVRIPDEIEVDGKVIKLDRGLVETRFGDYSRFYSPTKAVPLQERIENFPRSCKYTLATAIEKSGGSVVAN